MVQQPTRMCAVNCQVAKGVEWHVHQITAPMRTREARKSICTACPTPQISLSLPACAVICPWHRHTGACKCSAGTHHGDVEKLVLRALLLHASPLAKVAGEPVRVQAIKQGRQQLHGGRLYTPVWRLVVFRGVDHGYYHERDQRAQFVLQQAAASSGMLLHSSRADAFTASLDLGLYCRSSLSCPAVSAQGIVSASIGLRHQGMAWIWEGFVELDLGVGQAAIRVHPGASLQTLAYQL